MRPLRSPRDGHLVHFSTDNASSRWRAAIVFHYARAATVDRTMETKGCTIDDRMPALGK